ncbi:MAG: MOSC domain-containing protein, partial [Acidimicrobiaceae bacterium]|nr:MOSC domain-containing protein [Acidimicrobiaceae bacterium]
HVLSAKREGRLLLARAALAGGLRITLPAGDVITEPGRDADEALSAWLGYPVRLAAADPGAAPTFETQGDFYDDDSGTVTWEGVAGSWVDSRPVHLLTTAVLGNMAAERPDLDWSVERFRPNVLLDGTPQDLPEGQIDLAFDGVSLRVDKPCERCVMTTRPQPRADGNGGLPRQLDVLRHLQHTREGNFGVLARVVAGGRVQVGTGCRVATARG